MTDMLLIGIIPLLLIVGLLIFASRNLGHTTPKAMIGVVCTLVIGVILVGALFAPEEESTGPSFNGTMQYDDYLPIDATDATGAVELVELAGKTYLHASDIGAGSALINGDWQNIDVRKASLDVFLLIGQSNAAYFRYSPSEATAPALGTAYYYGTAYQPIQYTESYNKSNYAIYSMTNPNGTAHIGNIEAPFAAEYFKETGHKTLVINGARGGRPIETYLPGNYMYTWSQTVFSDAMALIDSSYYEVSVKSAIWLQGESDSNTPVQSYVSMFTSLFDALAHRGSVEFNEEYSIDSCMIVKTRAANSVNAPKAQITLSKTLEGVYLAGTWPDKFSYESDTMDLDDLHYSQKGDNIIGKGLAEYYCKYIA